MDKASIMHKVKGSPDLGMCADVFASPDSTTEEVIQAGDSIMRLLTDGSAEYTLGKQRYKEYKRRLLKGNKAIKAEVLPPTSGASEQHSLPTC